MSTPDPSWDEHPHVGSSLESFLGEGGRGETAMAGAMRTGRPQLGRRLGPDNPAVTPGTPQRAEPRPAHAGSAEPDVVYPLIDRPELGLKRGDPGALIHARPDARHPACLVEFVNEDGTTRAEGVFGPDTPSAGPVG